MKNNSFLSRVWEGSKMVRERIGYGTGLPGKWKVLASVMLLLTLGIGQMWGELPLTAIPEGTNALTNASGALTTWTTGTKNTVIYDDNNYFMAWSNGNALSIDGTGIKIGNSSKKSAIVFYVANESDISVGVARNGSDASIYLRYLGTTTTALTDPNNDSDGGGTACDEVAVSSSSTTGTLTKLSGAAGYYKVFGTLRFYATSIDITEITSGGGSGEDPEYSALSNDATLSDLKVGGTTISGFAAATLNYYYELDYGFTSYPAITYTKNHDGANIVYQDASEREDDCSIVKVTAEDGTTIKQYIIHFYAAPKYGVELIKATHNGTATGATITGYIGGTADKLTQNGGKLGSADHYFGVKLANDEQFKAGDLVVIKASTISATVELFDTKTFASKEDSVAYLNKGNFDANSKMYTFTLENDADQLYLYRTKTANKDMNPTIDYIAVYRYMAPFIESFEIEGIGALTIDGTNITAEVASDFDVTALTPTIKAWANGEAQIDKSGAQNFTNPVTYTVSSQYTEDATGAYAPVTYTVTITKVTPSATPTITTQPAGANYIEGATVAALSIVAEASDEGTLTYQWYLDEDAIDGATSATYTPTVSAIGSYSYTCVVTNTKGTKPAASVTSNAAVVVIVSDPSCATFASIPDASPYRYTNTGEWTIFNVNANGVRDDANNAFGTDKDYANNNVNIFGKQRCAIIFAKDMQRVVLYTNNGGSRDWASSDPVKVSADKDKFLGEVEGNPAYTAFAATTTMVQYDNDAKKVILTAEGDFEANKVYLFNFTNSVKIFKICAAVADPEADAPVFTGAALADEAVCPGDAFTTLDATAAPVVSYAWYKNNEVIEGATAATYTPTEAGTYYCIATNGGTGYRSVSVKSAEAVLSVNTATAIIDFANARGDVGASKNLSVTAEGTNIHYAWYTCDDAEGTNPVAVDPANDAATYGVTITEVAQYFKVVVSGGCGNESQVLIAEKWASVEQADVTGSMTWDWNTTHNANAWSGVANIQQSGAAKTTDILMANVSSAVPNNKYFRSDMLVVNGEYPARTSQDGGVFQGYAIKFHTTVPGVVSVKYRGTSGSDEVVLKINDWTAEAISAITSTMPTKSVLVQAGDVIITENAGKVLRIETVKFKADADYTRDVTSGYGTICLPQAGVIVGGSIFEVAYLDKNDPYRKIFFDEVVSGEMVAGRPYIFLPNEGVSTIRVFYTDNAEVDAGNYNGLYGFIGEDENDWHKVTANDHNYIIYGNQYHYVPTGADARILSNRAYLKIGDGVEGAVPTNAVAPAPGRRRVSMSAQGEQVATGVDQAQSDNVQCTKMLIDGQLFILRGEKMYDVTGRLIK